MDERYLRSVLAGAGPLLPPFFGPSSSANKANGYNNTETEKE